jgi:hypothetical protein
MALSKLVQYVFALLVTSVIATNNVVAGVMDAASPAVSFPMISTQADNSLT